MDGRKSALAARLPLGVAHRFLVSALLIHIFCDEALVHIAAPDKIIDGIAVRTTFLQLPPCTKIGLDQPKKEWVYVWSPDDGKSWSRDGNSENATRQDSPKFTAKALASSRIE